LIVHPANSITVYFFAHKDEELILKATKENLLKPVTTAFNKGHNQEFKQPRATGIDVSQFEESELTKVGEGGIFPVAFKVDVAVSNNQELEGAHDDVASKCLVSSTSPCRHRPTCTCSSSRSRRCSPGSRQETVIIKLPIASIQHALCTRALFGQEFFSVFTYIN
jgi:hypothetical protein